MRAHFCLSFLLITLIQLVYSYGSFTPPPHCQYDYLCRRDPALPAVPGFVGTTAADCQDACKQAVTDGGTCDHWTFEKYIETDCYLLTGDCIHDVNNHPDNLASGPPECTTEECEQLTYTPGVHTALWSCLYGPSSPYSEPIPDGSECSVSCPTWETAEGDGKVTATCTKGVWAVAPTGVMDSTPEEIISPKLQPNPSCTCNSITIPAELLETEPNGAGAELYCDKGEGNGYDIQPNGEGEPIVIEATWHCVFLCDRHPILDFSCFNGVWSDGVEDCTSIYCYHKPSNEECGLTPDPTTPQPTDKP